MPFCEQTCVLHLRVENESEVMKSFQIEIFFANESILGQPTTKRVYHSEIPKDFYPGKNVKFEQSESEVRNFRAMQVPLLSYFTILFTDKNLSFQLRS